MRPTPVSIDADTSALFGQNDDPIELVEARSKALYPDGPPIVWQGDPATFRFFWVSESAQTILGYPARRWIEEPTFWADVVVHADDKQRAIAYCALATAKGRDHVFEYRARAADGRLVWLRDLVRVVLGPKQIPILLRGVMFDVTAVKKRPQEPEVEAPTTEQLMAS